MRNLFTFSFLRNFAYGNGSGMDREWIGNGPIHSRQLFAVLVMLLCLGVGNAWGADPVATLDPVDGESYVVAFWNGTKYYALPNIGTSSSTYDGTEITVNASGYVTSDTPPLWKFEKAASGTYKGDWHLSYKKSATTYYLYKNGTGSSNYNISAQTSSSTYWRFTKSSNKYNVVATDRGTTNHTRLTYSSSKWKVTGNSSTTYDIILLQPAPAGPTITTSSSMTTFSCNMSTGIPVKQSFSVSGTALTNNVTITPPSGYEVCLTENGTYTSSVELSKGSGTLSSTTIYVKLKDDNAAGSYSGNIACTSSGATTKNVAVSGSTPFKVTWKANGTTHATTYVAYATSPGTAIGTLPSEPDADDYCGDVFYGWYDGASYSHASVAPSIIGTSTKITSDKTYVAVFADEEDGGTTTVYKLVSSLTNAKDYVFVTRNTAGSGYALSSSVTTGTSVTITTSGDDKIVSGTPANTIIWTAATGWNLQNKNTSTYLVINGGSFGLNASAGTLYWSTDYGLYVKSGSVKTSYYVQCSTGTFSKSESGSTTNRVWAYEKTTVSVKTHTNFKTTCCTNLGSINGSVSWSNGSKATLVWDKDANATGYVVKWKTHAGAEGTYATTNVSSINDTLTNKKTCAIPSLTAGTEYDFKILITGKTSPTVYCDKDSVMTATAPKITVTSAPVALSGSDYAAGSGPGTAQSFYLTGTGLEAGNLTITAPTNFQVSTDGGTNWGTSGGSQTLAVDGALSSTEIKVRLVSGLSEGTYGGATTYVTISGGGAAAVNSSVSITGTVSAACSVPSIGNPTLTSITSSTITVSCPTISGGTNCDVDEYGFIWKAGSAPTMASYDGKKKTGENNQSTAYSDGLSISVTTGTTYHIKAYAHNSAGNNVSTNALQVTPQSITFNSNGGSDVATKYANNGSTTSAPSAPTKTGYTFDSWRTTSGLTTAMNFSGTITKDTTLYAKWTANSYDVTLKTNGGSGDDKVVSATYNADMPLTLKNSEDALTGHTKQGHTLLGYWDNASAGNQYYSYNSSTSELSSFRTWNKAAATNLYAHWQANVYTVTLNANGGEDGATTSVDATYGSAMPPISSANLPTKEGYRFDGFYTDKTSGTKYYNADGTSAKNMGMYSATNTLYAHWKALTYFSVNGSVDGTLTIDDGAAMPSADVPTSCGNCWAFMGWSTDDEEDEAAEYASGATHTFGTPTTLYAVFGNNEFQLIGSTSELVANDYYVLTNVTSSKEYAISNTANPSYSNDAASTEVTANLREYGDGDYLVNIGSNNIWKFTGNASSGQLQNVGNTAKYLNLSGSGSILSTTNNLTFTNDGVEWTIYSTKYLRHYSANDWDAAASLSSGKFSCYIYHQVSSTVTTTPSCETYDIAWKVGSDEASGSPTEETTTCTGIEDLPDDPDNDELDCATKFVGWSEQELVGEGHDAPADLFTAIEDAPKIDGDKTFHAVFATTIGTSVDPIEDTSFSSKDENGSYCNGTFSFKSTGKYLQQQSIWTSSSIANVTVKIRVYHMSNSVADVLRVSLINSDGSEVVGKDLTTTKTGTDITSKGGWSDVVELTPTSAVTGYKVSLKTKNSSGVAINKIERELVASGVKDYVTICCDNSITIGTPSITGSGTVTFTLGGEDLNPGDDVETCTSAKDVVATVTPAAGYSCTSLTFSGGSVSVDPTPGAGNYPAAPSTQDYTLSFAKETTSATLSTSATFTAKPLTAWAWKYKKGNVGSADPATAIPDVVEAYIGEYVRFVIDGYTPSDVIAAKQGYVYDQDADPKQPVYNTDSLAHVGHSTDYYTTRGKVAGTATLKFKAVGDASITKTMTILTKALPNVTFVDNVHNKTDFTNWGTDGVVSSTVTTGVVTHTKPAPSHSDISDPGSNYNTCERNHVHLVGWIRSDWADEHPGATHSQITSVGNDDAGNPYYYAAGADVDVEAQNGKTFYAVWSKIE